MVKEQWAGTNGLQTRIGELEEPFTCLVELAGIVYYELLLYGQSLKLEIE